MAVDDKHVGLGPDWPVSRREAMTAGVSPARIRTLVARGDWQVVRSGWFVPRPIWEALDPYAGRARLEILAAHRSLHEPHAISHVSAAILHGLPYMGPPSRLVHVTKLKGPRTRVRSGVKHHQSRCLRPVVVMVDGVPVLTPSRTALDIAREDGYAAGVVVTDAVRSRGTSLLELEADLAAMNGWPHVTRAREALAFSDPGAESPGESLLRILVAELELGLPMETQFELRDATGGARCDLRVGRHVFEFDGAIKYRLPESGGVADRAPERILLAEKARQDWVCGFGMGMSRVVWAELWGLRRELTKLRLRREFEATAARLGTDIGDLAPYVVRRTAS